MKRVDLSPDAGPIARAVYQRMMDLGLDQKGLALTAGVNETYVRDLFQGRSKNPRYEHLAKIAGALGCTVLDLTEPELASGGPSGGEFVKDPDELALLSFWRKLTPVGRQLFLNRLYRGAPEPRE